MALRDLVLEYDKRQINDAGKTLAKGDNVFDDHSHRVLNNFRACHAYPLNTFQSTLRDKLKALGIKAIVSQRLKRTRSIVGKLKLMPNLNLFDMQDIGGLRAIVPSINDVYSLVGTYTQGRLEHEAKNPKDYITNPKHSGYRCYHLIYKYKNKKYPNYNGLKVELQIRTQLQHSWATAVETFDTFSGHELKSGQGPQEWKDFFAIVGHAFSFLEGTNPVPRYAGLSREKSCAIVKIEEARLEVIRQLEIFRVVVNADPEQKQDSLYLLTLDFDRKIVFIVSYPTTATEEASREYADAEERLRNSPNTQVVLVASNSIESLKKAYPNYFLNTEEFLINLKRVIAEAP